MGSADRETFDIRMTAVLPDEEYDVRRTQLVDFESPSAAGSLRTTMLGVGGGPDEDDDGVLVGAAMPFRPSIRPPMAILRIFDDNEASGELVRLRETASVLGRSEGQVVVPHDVQMSSRHAEISRREEGGRWNWYLRDLDSTNGTFVQADRVRLNEGDELLLGSRRFCFVGNAGGQGPALMEITPRGFGARVALAGSETWIGRDDTVCAQFLRTDSLLDQRHARVVRESDGRWYAYDSKSRNGVWVRVKQVRLINGGTFQLGEQRFRIIL